MEWHGIATQAAGIGCVNVGRTAVFSLRFMLSLCPAVGAFCRWSFCLCRIGSLYRLIDCRDMAFSWICHWLTDYSWLLAHWTLSLLAYLCGLVYPFQSTDFVGYHPSSERLWLSTITDITLILYRQFCCATLCSENSTNVSLTLDNSHSKLEKIAMCVFWLLSAIRIGK